MAEITPTFANTLVHSALPRRDQVLGLVWQAYPSDVPFDAVIALLESEGMPKQNRSRLRAALRGSGLVSQGVSRRHVRINPRHKARLDGIYIPLAGVHRRIEVRDSEAPLPVGTLPLTRDYIRKIVDQINEGYVASHYDAVAVMLRRLAESLTIECYVARGSQATIQRGASFLMLDELIGTLQNDVVIARSRNLVRQLRRIKDVGDTAAHSRSYVTKKADIDDIKFDARRAVSELSVLAGL